MRFLNPMMILRPSAFVAIRSWWLSAGPPHSLPARLASCPIKENGQDGSTPQKGASDEYGLSQAWALNIVMCLL